MNFEQFETEWNSAKVPTPFLDAQEKANEPSEHEINSELSDMALTYDWRDLVEALMVEDNSGIADELKRELSLVFNDPKSVERNMLFGATVRKIMSVNLERQAIRNIQKRNEQLAQDDAEQRAKHNLRGF